MARQSTEQALKNVQEALVELEAVVEEAAPPAEPPTPEAPAPDTARDVARPPRPSRPAEPDADRFESLPPAVAERLRAAMALRGAL